MTVFVIGGSGSGKSEFAEGLIVRGGFTRRAYIATMEPYGNDAAARIARHRALRAGKGFETVERYRDLPGLEVPQGCGVLLEDLTNLFANEWFGAGKEGAAGRVLSGLAHLEEAAGLVVAVGNDLFSDGVTYDKETEDYLNSLAVLHRTVAARAGAVYEVVCGIPVRHKGAGL